MTLIAFLLLTGALAAALAAAAQQGRELRRLREDLDALAQPRLVTAAIDAVTVRAPRMFSSLYEDATEDAVAKIGRLPGVPMVALAVVLGLAGSGLTVAAAARQPVRDDREPPSPALAAVDSLALLRASRDSLQQLVTQLRDSVRQSGPRAASRPVTVARSRPPRPREERRAAVAPAPELPPAPLIDARSAPTP